MSSRLLVGARVRRMACVVVALVFVRGPVRGVAAQEAVFQGSISSDDGGPAEGGDGALNGTGVGTPDQVLQRDSPNAVVIQTGAVVNVGRNPEATRRSEAGSGVYLARRQAGRFTQVRPARPVR